jgi:hypothetical protein
MRVSTWIRKRLAEIDWQVSLLEREPAEQLPPCPCCLPPSRRESAPSDIGVAIDGEWLFITAPGVVLATWEISNDDSLS